MLELRPHHLFCMALFRGAGYSAAFTENMTAKTEALCAGEPCTLVSGADCICAACPNRAADGACALGGDVFNRDSAALSAANAVLGETGTLRDFAARLLGALTPEAFDETCGGCRWRREGLCGYEALIDGLKRFL